MNNRITQLAFIVTVVLMSSCHENQKKNDEVLFENIPLWIEEYNVPTVGIGIVEDGKILHAKVYGKNVKGMSAPDNTLFNLASITKTVTAIIALKYVEEGKWSLDEPLANYWVDPDVKDDSLHKKLTTRHVLTHQTGFVNWRWNHPTKKLTFDFEPGTDFNYSGEGIVYLQRAMEKKFKISFEQMANSLLFTPLEMKDTRLKWEESINKEVFAFWHNSEGKLHERAYKDKLYKTGVSSADDLITTVEDFCKYGIYVMNGAGLSKSLFAEMVKPQSKKQKFNAWGLGWNLILKLPDNEYAIEHSGSDIGVQTEAIFLPKSKRGIVVFTNGDNGLALTDKIIRSIFKNGKILRDHQQYYPDMPEVIKLDMEQLSRFEGKYLLSDNSKIEVKACDNSLLVKGFGPILSFYPESSNTFFIKEANGKIKFKNNENSSISGFTVYLNGKVFKEATVVK